uniref:PDZ domain-containing protein n=1 Tax=Prymnesium polylepis TaxID=72548 RepID=A0A6T7WV07_9EUKA|mmetsp:Transcript_31543/g.86265  ORF Transcript_31543/g.86265 Transcript_31543/m.86265 type:complete len:405 (-) Transcript_31543:139-1353(-)
MRCPRRTTLHHPKLSVTRRALPPRLSIDHAPSWQQQALAAVLSLSIAVGNPAANAARVIDLDTPLSALQQQEQTVETLFEDATPSVVFISTFVEKTDRFTMDAVEVPAGTGSGFVWDDAGHVVTNYHVIRGANAAKVAITRPDKSEMFDAKLVGYNPDKDVAVLSIDSRSGVPLKPISLGSSSALRVGQTTLAIGNPFGLDHSLTVGVVSGLGREVSSPSGRPITNVIQTDAAINPGNSGGALLDSRGRLIGMNTAILSPSGSSAGIGFAIPVDTLKQQVDTILQYGRVLRPAIGISYAQGAQARALGVQRGVLVLAVPERSAAKAAGLRGSYRGADGEIVLGDVITRVNDDSISSDGDLFKALDKYAPGASVVLTVERPTRQGAQITSQTLQLTVKLQAAEAA